MALLNQESFVAVVSGLVLVTSFGFSNHRSRERERQLHQKNEISTRMTAAAEQEELLNLEASSSVRAENEDPDFLKAQEDNASTPSAEEPEKAAGGASAKSAAYTRTAPPRERWNDLEDARKPQRKQTLEGRPERFPLPRPERPSLKFSE